MSSSRHPFGAAAELPLRVLHLEDTENDRELVRLSLQDAGFRCEFTYASSEREFEAALASGEFDLILSDFTLPGYHGAYALALARARIPDVPYVFLSGTIGEERAIESLKSGATDYVLKDHIERLVPAVRRALREAAERAQRKATDEALRQSEERFREMAETIQDVFWVASPDSRKLTYVSPAYEVVWQRARDRRLVSWADWIDAVMPEDRAPLAAARDDLNAGRKTRLEYRIRRPSGALRWIEERGYPILNADGEVKRIVGVAVDITERMDLQSQLIQAQKLEAIGFLAGGVAHDFNNVLSVINAYTEMLAHDQPQTPAAVEQLKEILAASRRAATLVRQLLVFSRREAMRQQTVNLNDTVRDIAKMLERLIGERIKLNLDLAPEPAWVRADAGMMEQVVANLSVNARDAMPKGGSLSISIHRETLGPERMNPKSAARPGEFVRLEVRDTGCGIPAENLDRIFEPFFTTKPDGTGLGLATVSRILQQHRGWIDVRSEIGRGTSFSIFFPAVTAERPAAAAPVGQASIEGGDETILLVEDELTVRQCAAAILQRFGYRVLEAGTSKQALDVWRNHQTEIQLLLTDLILPDRLTGLELADVLKKDRPKLKVVLTTGYLGATQNSAIAERTDIHFVHKPYDVWTLAKTIRQALAEV